MKSQVPAMEQIELLVFPQIQQSAKYEYTKTISAKRNKTSRPMTDEKEDVLVDCDRSLVDAPPVKKIKKCY